jgi:Zn-dependent protease with chaperone function
LIQAFNGQLHGPGHPGAGTPTRAEFVGATLMIAGHGIDAARITVEAGGFNQEDVVMTWDGPEGPCALMVSAPEAKRALLASAPAALAPALHRWHRSAGFSNAFWKTAIALTAGSAIALVLMIWQFDVVAAWAAGRVSPENERRLGQSVMEGMHREGRLIEESLALDAIRDIGGRLAADSTRKYEWYLKDDPSINAFAAPGGFIVVHTGLINAIDTPDELAGVLAHEIQHVEQRHALQLLIYNLGWATALGVLLGDPSTLTTIVLLQAGSLTFNREFESQADAEGLETLRKAGVPPESLAAFFKKMLEKDRASSLDWLSTHPSTEARVAKIEATLKDKPCAECKPIALDWAAVRESLYADKLIRRPKAQKK